MRQFDLLVGTSNKMFVSRISRSYFNGSRGLTLFMSSAMESRLAKCSLKMTSCSFRFRHCRMIC